MTNVPKMTPAAPANDRPAKTEDRPIESNPKTVAPDAQQAPVETKKS